MSFNPVSDLLPGPTPDHYHQDQDHNEHEHRHQHQHDDAHQHPHPHPHPQPHPPMDDIQHDGHFQYPVLNRMVGSESVDSTLTSSTQPSPNAVTSMTHTVTPSSSEAPAIQALMSLSRAQSETSPQDVNTDSTNTKDKETVKGKGELSPSIAVSITGSGEDSEKSAASMALRTATWISVFYLITTDVLGPTSAPWAVAQLGYVPGSLIFLSLGVVAAYTGFLLWYLFLKLDSPEQPVRTYSDVADRLFGRWARHSVNIFQSIQLLFNVAVIILGNAQGLSQIAQYKVCFVVLSIIWTACGMIVGQIKQLQNLGILANAAIWMNLFVVFATMGVAANSSPNYDAAAQQSGVAIGPVQTVNFVNPDFNTALVAVMQIVYSYGGAMMFIEFMSEMRNPKDFWKAMVSSLSVIMGVYLLFGLYLYSNQGQFVINPANQGLSPYGWQTATNVIQLVSALIAAGLYGNVGMKVIYQSVIRDIFYGPPLDSLAGRVVWTTLVVCYWSLAFVVASAIPQFSNVSGLVAALCIMQFTYTFPPLFRLAYDIQNDGDSWRRDWKRKLFHRWWFKLFNLLLTLAALACSGMGMYSSIESMIQGFKQAGAASSFGCQSPV